MIRPAPAGRGPLSVTQLTERIRDAVRAGGFWSVTVRGEITGLKFANGHAWFSLKDPGAVIPCVAWRDDAARMPRLENGHAVIVTGRVDVYPKQGRYQCVVSNLELDGAGDLHARFEELKRKLDREGLFASERKRALPAFPFRIALVSSRGAAGANDFVRTLRERAPHVRIAFCETPVQGTDAPPAIARAIAKASLLDVDAIVVTRGGGSFEDMFCFSDERVVRAIVAARHPVVSAIGHSTDRQLSDFAADVYCDTPTAAAAAIGPAKRELDRSIAEALATSRRFLAREINERGERLRSLAGRPVFAQPERLFDGHRRLLVDAERDLATALGRSLERKQKRFAPLERRVAERNPLARVTRADTRLQGLQSALERRRLAAFERGVRRLAEANSALDRVGSRRVDLGSRALERLEARLDARNPTAILERGYALVEYEGHVVSDAGVVPLGATVRARLARGTLTARVESRTDAHE